MAAMVQLLTAASDPFARDHMQPGHFTASAFIVTADLKHILLIWHSKLHRWLQPGGHFEATDADFVAAARREVAEETGLTALHLLAAPFDLDVHVIPARKSDPAHQHFDVRCLFESPTMAGAASSDAEGLQWVALDAVDQLASDASVLRAVNRLLAMRAKRRGLA